MSYFSHHFLVFSFSLKYIFSPVCTYVQKLVMSTTHFEYPFGIHLLEYHFGIHCILFGETMSKKLTQKIIIMYKHFANRRIFYSPILGTLPVHAKHYPY